jgi:hypothetical protein
MKRILDYLIVFGIFMFPVTLKAFEPYRIPESVTREHSKIIVGVFPQVELISVVQIISKYPAVLGFLMSNDSSGYKSDVIEYFSSYKSHPVVHMFDRLSQQPRMLNFSAPSNIMLYTNDTLGLRTDIVIDEFVTNRAGGTDSLKLFLNLLRDFARQSSFNKFFRDHNDFYVAIRENTIKNMGDIDYISELESFYGKEQQSYNIVLVTLYNFVGYGNSLLFPSGKREIYNTMGPRSVVDNFPFFGDNNYLKYMIRHEFSHPFINPLTEKYWDNIKDYSFRYDSIPEAARKKVCGDWQECINEFIIRAITTHLAYNENDDAGLKAFRKEDSSGVSYLDRLLVSIKIYNKERVKYPSFESFYPIVLNTFK